MISNERSMEAIYDDLWNVGEVERWATAQQTLAPRTPARLFALVAEIGLNPTSLILDVGCGQGDHACELASRFGVQVIAMDMVESSLASTRQRIAEKNLATQIRVQKGVIEQLPFADGEFDLAWCRSVIVHLPDLLTAFRQCWRVLKPGGYLMLQTGYATDLLEPQEAAALCQRLGFVWNSLQQPTVEAALTAAGLTIVQSEAHGSEFAEYYEKRDGRCAHHLMGIARLQRTEADVVARFGRATYETALGMYYWQIYQMLGKISYHAYLLQKS
ncbi:MAG: class I SAM-dependent methyltransferase [Caldilineaceae bacterium]